MFHRETRLRGHTSNVKKRSNNRYFKLIFRQLSTPPPQQAPLSSKYKKRQSTAYIRNTCESKYSRDGGDMQFAATGNLNNKIKEIEKIRNFQNPSKKLNIHRSLDESPFLKSEKISKSTYQRVTTLNKKWKEKKRIPIYGCAAYPALTYSEIKSLHEEPPNEFCNFVTGFQNYCKNEEEENLSTSTNLTKLKSKISKSQILQNCYTQLTKKDNMQKLGDNDLGPNFASAVKVMQYIRKSGNVCPKAKTLLQKSNCCF